MTNYTYNPGYPVTSGLGARKISYGSDNHKGTDFGKWDNGSSIEGASIHAASSGTVVFSGYNTTSTLGYVIAVRSTAQNGSSYITLYAHMESASPWQVGQQVIRGDVVGEIGRTGNPNFNPNATISSVNSPINSKYNPHLHFELSPETSGAGGWTFNPTIDSSGNGSLGGNRHQIDSTTFNGWADDGKPHGWETPLEYKNWKGSSVSYDASKEFGGENNIFQPYTNDETGQEETIFEEGAEAVIGGIEYVATEILNSLSDAATAVGDFIQDLAASGTEWFSSGGAQTAFSSWLSQNVDDMLTGDMTGEEAIISLGQYMAGSFLSNFVVNDVLDAKVAIAKVLYDEFDVGKTAGSISPVYQDIEGKWHLKMEDDGAGNPMPATEAGRYAEAFGSSLTSMALVFVTSGFDAETAVNVGISTLAGELAAKYLVTQFPTLKGLEAGAISTAVMTAVQGLLDFDGDWAQLGIQVGTATAIYVVTTALAESSAGVAINEALGGMPLGVDPASIIAGILVSLVASKLIGKLFGAKHFGPGEFGSIQQVLDSTYQIQTVVINGVSQEALVAVHPQGSTIIASTSTIGYILGGSGADVLVGGAGVNTLNGNAGSDYLEGRMGDDNLLGGDGNDHLSGGEGKDILQGDGGEDIIFGDADDDTMIAGAGDDFVHGGTGADIASGGTGRDYILAAGDDDAVSGDDGDDVIDGGYGDDSLLGGTGNDLILGNYGNDHIELMRRCAANDNWDVGGGRLRRGGGMWE